MSATAKWVATAAIVLVLLILVGAGGMQRFRSAPARHVEMVVPAAPVNDAGATSKASPPQASVESSGLRGSSTGAAASAGIAEADRGPEPPTAPNPSESSSTPAPSFDVVRVEPSGDALLAGRSKPGSTVALIDKGKVVADAKADASGNFVMTPPPLKPGNYALSLRTGQGGGAQESKQSVVVSVPASKTQQVVVAMAEPGRPTTLLSVPPEGDKPTAPAPVTAPVDAARPSAKTPPSAAQTAPAPTLKAPPPKLAIRSVELENGSGLFASGVAPPGTDVRLYLNNSRVADVVAAAVGAWSVTVQKGLSAGHYAVRVDALKPDRSVTARVEVPFDVPATMSDGRAGKKDEASSRAGTTKTARDPAVPPRAAAVASRPDNGGAAQPPKLADTVPPPANAAAPGPDAATAPPARTVVAAADATAGSPVTSTAADRPSVTADVPSVVPPTRATASSANVVVDELQTETVFRGDNLWRISRKRLGFGKRYTQIYAANSAQIRDPRLIYPGQVFVVPRE